MVVHRLSGELAVNILIPEKRESEMTIPDVGAVWNGAVRLGYIQPHPAKGIRGHSYFFLTYPGCTAQCVNVVACPFCAPSP